MKRIVITGASAGIGAAIARRLVSSDVHLILLARRLDKLEELKTELGSDQITIAELDVSSRIAVEKTFAELGPIDVLINNAGAAFGVDRAFDASVDDWDKCIDVNIKGLLYCTHSVLPGMVKRNSGYIINMGSIAGTYPYPGGNVYCGTKAFVHQFSLGLKADLLGTKVRVSCIEPGLLGGTEFSVVRFKGNEAKAHALYEKIEALQPEDIAEIVHFCLSLPPHVNINTLEVMPVCQASSALAVDKG